VPKPEPLESFSYSYSYHNLTLTLTIGCGSARCLILQTLPRDRRPFAAPLDSHGAVPRLRRAPSPLAPAPPPVQRTHWAMRATRSAIRPKRVSNRFQNLATWPIHFLIPPRRFSKCWTRTPAGAARATEVGTRMTFSAAETAFKAARVSHFWTGLDTRTAGTAKIVIGMSNCMDTPPEFGNPNDEVSYAAKAACAGTRIPKPTTTTANSWNAGRMPVRGWE
jgi:hypothetical protein